MTVYIVLNTYHDREEITKIFLTEAQAQDFIKADLKKRNSFIQKLPRSVRHLYDLPLYEIEAYEVE